MKATKEINMPTTPDKGQSETWDFPIHQEELMTRGGVASGIHAVVRDDSGAVVGQYRGEKALPYRQYVETFERAATELGLPFERKLFTTGGGSRFFGEYKLRDSMNIQGEMFAPIVRIQTSHDGSLARGWTLEVERLLCLNGMMGLAAMVAINQKHSVSLKAQVDSPEELDFQFIKGNLLNSIENGANQTKDIIAKMSATRLDTYQVRNILSNIVEMGKTKGVSPRTGLFIHENWKRPSEDERGLGDTMFRLYNATTRFCRDVKTVGRFEQSRKANLFTTGALALAVGNPHNLSKLLATPQTALAFDETQVFN